MEVQFGEVTSCMVASEKEGEGETLMSGSVEGGGDTTSSSGRKEQADEEVEKHESSGQEEIEVKMRGEEETFSEGDVVIVERDGG
jgi:hypothetical protein